ncbi:MAG: purine-nucleoside phosphorylase [Candidatus Euphemobacter frigidus]|nr:purine-nucleoside phosphorylase [Candidatus Euphemobacter frigidus]MDP8275703.1 purine-nucleoside phosphorylase [Candidatus Euphemobacter frigidus]
MIIEKEKVRETVEYLSSRTEVKPEIGIILGSGLGAVVKLLEDSIHIPYPDIPNFPVSSVKGHGGKLAFGTYAGKGLVVQEGRVHFYEGLGAAKVMYPLWVMKALGVKTIINTNAAGGINPNFAGGDLMLVKDHINFMFTNPLIGPNDESIGPRFPDISEAYNPELGEIARHAAEKIGIKLQSGILISFPGPSYETRAEIAMAIKLGADAVGMSTVPEAIVSSYLGLRFLAITFISNLVSPTRTEPLTHKDVTRAAARASKNLAALIGEIIKEMG